MPSLVQIGLSVLEPELNIHAHNFNFIQACRFTPIFFVLKTRITSLRQVPIFPVLKHIQSMVLPYGESQVSHPYRTTGKIIALYSLISRSSDWKIQILLMLSVELYYRKRAFNEFNLL
jgi:hypothetical protein